MIALRFGIWLAGLILALALLWGCASKGATAINERNTAIQECIINGGHAHLGPGNTIICIR